MSEDVMNFSSEVETYGPMQAGVNDRPPHDEPEQVSPQSYKGYYKDWTQQCEHILLHHAFNGSGGFKGDIPINYENPEQPNQNIGVFSYIMPMFTEMQYRNRVKQTVYYNYLARYINSIVDPVFSQDNIETVVKFNDVAFEDPYTEAFLKDCTGTGVPYKVMQKTALKYRELNDVVYLSMTKQDNSDIPRESMYRAIDVIYSTSEESGELESIMLYRGKEYRKVGEDRLLFAIARKFYMLKDECVIETFAGEWNGILGDWGDVEWESEGVAGTGVGEMVVKPFLKEVTPSGEWLPENPSMMRVMNPCMAIFQEESRISWLFALHCLTTPVIWGNINGALLGAGNMIAQDINNPEKGYAPKPDYMSTPSGHLTEAMSKLQHSIERLREIAKENGVDTKTGSQAQSGDSKRFDFQATEQKLRGTVEAAREMDEWVFHMLNVYQVRNDDVYTYSRVYPKDFYPEETATLDEYGYWAELAKENGMQETFNAIVLQGVKKLLGKSLTKDAEKAIFEEVSKMTLGNSNAE